MPECRLEDGAILHYRDRGDGPALVMLHGWGMSLAAFSELEEQLASRCRCLSLDLPGHGDSPCEDSFALDRLAGLVAAFCARLELDRPVLLGWSLGGMVALRLAGRPGSGLGGLVLVGTTPRFVASPDWPHGLPELQLRALRRDLRRNPAKALGGFFQLMFSPDRLPRERFRQIVRFAAGRDRLPATTTALAGLELLREVDLRPELDGLALPSLVMHGGEDRIVPVAAGRWLAESISGAEFALFPDAGHAPFLEQPTPFCHRLARFLDGCPEA